jgi:uncharacterized protein
VPDTSGGTAGGERWRRIGRLALTYGLATACGAAAVGIGIPLPWMLGPFFVFAGLSASGARFALVPMGRELGQVAIGTAVGLRFTGGVLVAMAALVPAMVLATLYVIGFTLAAAFLLKPLAKVDAVTAFFATAAGGVADMAHVAKGFGGEAGSVAVVHAMRVSMVVAIVPFLVYFFGEHGSAAAEMAAAGHAPGNLALVALVLGLGYLGARILKPTPLPNPWLVGPILMGMVIGVSGLVEVRVPPAAIVVAQIALGTWLGCQFRRELLTALPRVTAAAATIALFMVGCAALGALVMAAATGLPYTTAFLALAPAAVTEMVLTAQVMNLDAEIVSAFHVMRIAVVSSTVLLVFRLHNRLRGAIVGSRT